MRSACLLAALAAGCHVTRQSELVMPLASERIVHAESAQPRAPALVLTDAGTLRFVEPLECPSEELVTTKTAIETEVGPNLATFVVGVIATAVGGILVVRGVTSDDATEPLTYAGAAGLAVGLPFAIGPWIGNRTERRDAPAARAPERRPGPSQACGERALAASFATLAIRGVEVFGAIAADGTFAVSPYQLVDAFDTRMVPAWDVTATVETAAGARTVQTVIEGGALAARAPAFLAHVDFDAAIEPLRVVPTLTAGTLRASLTQTAGGPALRLVLPVKNDGPGDAYALRGLVSSSHKPIDGRVLYLGRVPKGATVTRELLVPLSRAAAETIRNTTLEIAIELRDAHGTAPTTPVRFRGAVLVDLPR